MPIAQHLSLHVAGCQDSTTHQFHCGQLLFAGTGLVSYLPGIKEAVQSGDLAGTVRLISSLWLAVIRGNRDCFQLHIIPIYLASRRQSSPETWPGQYGSGGFIIKYSPLDLGAPQLCNKIVSFLSLN